MTRTFALFTLLNTGRLRVGAVGGGGPRRCRRSWIAIEHREFASARVVSSITARRVTTSCYHVARCHSPRIVASTRSTACSTRAPSSVDRQKAEEGVATPAIMFRYTRDCERPRQRDEREF